MSALLKAVRRARKRRDVSAEAFRRALEDACKAHSLSEVGAAAGLTKQGVRYLVVGDTRKREDA